MVFGSLLALSLAYSPDGQMSGLADHRNALDLLRLSAAWMVLFSHQFALLGFQEPLWLGRYSWGELGVGIFFFLSGGLVWGSWCRDPHLMRFFARRCLRIFPALAVVVALSVLLLGPWLTTLGWTDYWQADGTWRYFKTVLLNNQKGLPGVFEANPLADAVNGSLWSLGPEFLAYVVLALVATLLSGWRKDRTVFILLGVMLALLTGYVWKNGQSKPHFEVLVLFGWGACWEQWRALRRQGGSLSWPTWVLAVLLFLLGLGLSGGVSRLILLLNVALLVSWAHRLSWGHRALGRLGDLSYGMYIYAFPVQQTLIHWFPQWHWGLHLLVATILTMVLAWLSWHGIEKLALRFKPAVPIVMH